jgi:hypothetical protein
MPTDARKRFGAQLDNWAAQHDSVGERCICVSPGSLEELKALIDDFGHRVVSSSAMAGLSDRQVSRHQSLRQLLSSKLGECHLRNTSFKPIAELSSSFRVDPTLPPVLAAGSPSPSLRLPVVEAADSGQEAHCSDLEVFLNALQQVGGCPLRGHGQEFSPSEYLIMTTKLLHAVGAWFGRPAMKKVWGFCWKTWWCATRW